MITTTDLAPRSTDLDAFHHRHIGPDAGAQDEMLRAIGVPTLDALIDQTVPSGIRFSTGLELPPAETEAGYLRRLRGVAARNRVTRSCIGMGYYDTHTPAVILRNVFENPGWYTPYTPYQAEIAQGRLESLLNFQTMVRDLTGMDIASASLLDEGTAAAEAMTMFHRVNTKKAPAGRESLFLVAGRTFPQTLDVVKGRAEPLKIRVEAVEPAAIPQDTLDRAFGLLLQYPDDLGEVVDLAPVIERAHAAGLLVAVATDLMALTLLMPPGEMGADAVVGNSQRFGVPLGYGGPHAAFFATRESFVRQAPGRIIGVSVDAQGHRAYRMALQTREQHIRREKATSNICTAQALLANIAAMYAVFHGPQGLRAIGERIHAMARAVEDALSAAGLRQSNAAYFDTLRIEGADAPAVRGAAEAAGIDFRYFADGAIGISVNETTTIDDVADIVRTFTPGQKPVFTDRAPRTVKAPIGLRRTSAYLSHPVFNSYHSETDMMRYIRRLERKDVGLDTSMIPLGSCTMKLNAAAEMLPVSWPEFSRMHPFAPPAQAAGYREVFRDLESALCEITGFAGMSLQPNSGAQGEFAGLMTIRAYHRDRGEAGTGRRADSGVGARHQSGERVDGGPARRRGRLRCQGIHRTGRSSRQGDAAPRHAGGAHGHLSLDLRHLRRADPRNLRHRPRARRPGVHGRRQHERAGRVDESGLDRRRRLPSQPAQDVRHSARRRRSGYGADWRGAAPRAVPARPSGREGRGREGDPGDLGRAVGQRQHPADLVRLYPDAWRAGHDGGHEGRHPERQLHQGASRIALRRPVREPQRPCGARADFRPPAVQARIERRRRRTGRRETPDGLRISRPHGLVPGSGNDDGGADRERAERRNWIGSATPSSPSAGRSAPSSRARPTRKTTS